MMILTFSICKFILDIKLNSNNYFKYDKKLLIIEYNKNILDKIKMDSFEYFSFFIFPPVILVIGLAGNFLGFKTIQRPKMVEIGPRNTYKYLFISDTIYLVQIIVTFLQLSFNIDLTVLSNFACKLWWYFNYSLATQSTMLLVYISIDRYVSIKIPALRFFMRKRNNQLIYFIFIFMFNLVYYLPVTYNYSLKVSNNSLICELNNQYSTKLISYMDLANRVFLPSFLIIIFSTLLGIEVIKSRSRILANFQREENEYFFKNISLAITSIIFNIIYMSLQFPVTIFVLLPNLSMNVGGYIFSYYLFYLSYSINFNILYISNSLFREEFISFLKGSIKPLFSNN
jgi:hypothetical protein